MSAPEVVVVRNAGGHAKQSLRSILVVDFLMGLRDIIVVHHTDCGTTKFRDEQIRASLKERIPDQGKEIDAMIFGEIAKYVRLLLIPALLIA
jgi:carbonic anhydrase